MMVDPFQTLDNAAGSTGSCEKSDNILVLQLINMSEDTTNLEKSNIIASAQQILNAETKTQTEEEKTTAEVACVQEKGSLPKDDDDEKMIMGGPSTSETELIVLPSCSSECDTFNSADDDDNGPKKHLANNNCHEKKELSEPDSSTVKTNTKVLLVEKPEEHHVLSCESNALVNENCDNQQNSIQSGVSSSSAVVFNNNISVKKKLSTTPPPPPPPPNSVISSNDQIDNSSSHKLGQVESLLKMEENHNNNSNSSPTSTTEVNSQQPTIDNRKVEPLKINLNRDPIILKLPKPPQELLPEIIPKITIKPIQKPAAIANEDSTTASGTMANNISTNLEAPPEPHIVPKLTIRNSTNSSGLGSQSVIVPKLTIKMDNHVGVSQNTSKDKSVILEDGVKLTIKSVPETPPPIPKLTIKTSSGSSTSCSVEEKSECVNNIKYSINAGPSSPLMTRANAKAMNAKQTENTVPKLKIKLNSDDSSSQALNVNCTEIKTVPKLVVRVPPKDQLDVDEIPAEGSTSDDEEMSIVETKEPEPNELESIPKLTIRQVKNPEYTSEETIVIPKVTIKPIVNPNNEQEDLETLVTPKITLKPIPKPLDITQPLEVVTSCPPTSSFKAKLESVDSHQQQSPRIVIKINKNVSETITKNEQPEKEPIVHEAVVPVPVDNKKQTQDAQVSSSLSLLERCLKRSAPTSMNTSVESKKQKIENEPPQKPEATDAKTEADGNNVEKEKTVPPITINLSSVENDEEKLNLILTPETTTTTTAATTSPTDSIKICDEQQEQHQESKKNLQQLNTALYPLYCDEKISSPPNVHSLDESDPMEERHPLDNILFNHHHHHRDSSSPSPVQVPQHLTNDSRRQQCSEVIVVSEESSSDCIMVEDNGAISFAPTAFNIEQFNKNGHNVQQQKDLSNSLQSTPQQSDKSHSDTSLKRGRGRPRKAGVPYRLSQRLDKKSATPAPLTGDQISVQNILGSNLPNFSDDIKITRSTMSKSMNAKPSTSLSIDEDDHSQKPNEMPTIKIQSPQTPNEMPTINIQKPTETPTIKIQKTKPTQNEIIIKPNETPLASITPIDVSMEKKNLAQTISDTIVTTIKKIDHPPTAIAENKIESNVEFNSPPMLFPIRREDNNPATMLHPLLMQDIQRAQLLEALMGTNSKIESAPKTMTDSSSSVVSDVPQTSQSTIEMSEDSSSDCIMVEDNNSRQASQSFAVAKVEDEQNKSYLESAIDRDSGVDVSNSLKSLVDANEIEAPDTPSVKRGRGRPKKSVTALVAENKQQLEEITKRKFAGVLMSEHNAKVTEMLNIVPIATTTTTEDDNNSNAEKSDVKPEKKRRIRIDDDDESPTFNPLSRSIRRGRGRGGRGSRGGRGKFRSRGGSASTSVVSSPEKSRDGTGIFTTPEGRDKKKPIKEMATLQVFEEDTRMSADSLSTPMRNSEFLQNEESQSSILSTASATVESSTTKKRSKLEVVDLEGKTEFTVDMIAEYDWPPPKGCCPARNRDTFMIQEQIAEYLGVKSFKRKYPDLPRRLVEMEERNYLLERGMVSEKMCDLGLTAVLASDILDIMHNDFYEKYEEYKKYLRHKQLKDLAAKQKAMQMEAVEKNLSAREHAIQAAASWNTNFNKSRTEDRRQCLDLQNLVIHMPEGVRNKMTRPTSTFTSSNYPVALVPGQFQEYHRKYNAAELLCYPINTALADPYELDKKLREYSRNQKPTDSDSDSSSSESDDESSDDSSSDSSDSSDEETIIKDEKCRVCNKLQNSNQDNKPELFVACSVCRRKAHPSCIEMPHRMTLRVREYKWQCAECKYCSKCRQKGEENKILYCDQCDRGYHIYCIGLQVIPSGRWHCDICLICTNCGSRRPEGQRKPNLTNQQYRRLLSTSKWTHEYRINHVSNLREHAATLCVPCARIMNDPKKT